MNSSLLKNSLKTGGIFLLTYAVLTIYTIIYSVQSQARITISEVLTASIYLFLLVLFFLILFYFLFKYSKEEDHNKKLFWKLPLIGLVTGLLVFIGYILITNLFYGGLESMAGFFVFFIGLPLTLIISAIIALILSFNIWFRTNLYIVVWTIFLSVLIPVIILSIFNPILEKYDIIQLFLLWTMPFGFLIGTIFAVIKKFKSQKVQ